MPIHTADRFSRLPQAVLFDIDNTLYAYDPAHAAGLGAVRDKVTKSFTVTPERFDAAFADARAQVKERLKSTAASHSRLLYMQRLLEILGLGSQVLFALDLEQTYWRTFLSHAVLFDGVKEMLDDLRLLGVASAAITDLTAQIQFRKLVYFGLDAWFDYIVTSEEVGVDKPDPLPYQTAIAKLGCEGDRVWMIGDDPVCDLRGARKALNAVTLQKLHRGVKAATGADLPDATFEEFEELRSLLAKLAKTHVPDAPQPRRRFLTPVPD